MFYKGHFACNVSRIEEKEGSSTYSGPRRLQDFDQDGGKEADKVKTYFGGKPNRFTGWWLGCVLNLKTTEQHIYHYHN